MNKVPVGRTISSAYVFTFGHIGAVIGLIWLPLLIYYVARFFIVNYAESVAASGDPTSGGRATLVLIAFWFLSVFFTAVVGVALTRQALNPKPGNIIVNLVLGQSELNYFLALLTVFAVMLAVYIGVVLLAAVAGGIATAIAMGASALWLAPSITAVVIACAAAALLYIAVRLAYLVAPVTVSEGRIDLVRAWQASRGNFWRILAVLVATIGPIVIVSQVAFAAIVGPNYVAALFSLVSAIFHAIASGNTPQPQLLQRLPDISSKTPLVLGLGFLLAPFFYGLLYSSASYAYRALVGATRPPQDPDVGPFKAA